MRKFFVMLLLVIATPALADSTTTLYTQALTAKKNGQFVVAIDTLQRALKTKPHDAELWLELGRNQAFLERYEEALTSLDKARSYKPTNDDIALTIAQVQGWNKAYAEAEATVAPILSKNPTHYEALLLKARLAYYQSQLSEAEKILMQLPANQEVQAELVKIRKAKDSPHSETAYRWQFDSGYEYSQLSRTDQSDWTQSFAQLTYKPGKNTALHVRQERLRRFDTIDSYSEVGINHRLSDPLAVYAYIGIAPDADFISKWKLQTGGSYRVFKQLGFLGGGIAMLDTRFDHYATDDIATIAPGWQQYLHDRIYVTGQRIILHEKTGYSYGWLGRIDGEITDHLHGFIGWADAPETVAGETVRTDSVFAGLSYRVNERLLIRVNYAHDNRERSYVRDTVSTSFSVRF